MFRCLGSFLLLSVLEANAARAQTVTIIANLTNATGTSPDYAALVQGIDGNFYGTAQDNGPLGSGGSVFKVTPEGTVMAITGFETQNSSTPAGGLLEDQEGNFFGTLSQSGSTAKMEGAVFKITPSGTLTYLLTFNNNNGADPQCTLVRAIDQNLYGTATLGDPVDDGLGGANGDGVVFRLGGTPSFQILHVFSGSATDGSQPAAGLLQASDGNFYGTTQYGGANNDGTVFRITAEGVFTLLHSFDGSDGNTPTGALLQADGGELYGTTSGVEHGGGSIFKITLTGEFTLLYHFPSHSKGDPFSGLIQATDGNFYGTTTYGGEFGGGTIFSMTPGGTITTIYNFDRFDADQPVAALLQATDGNLYGTTYLGGPAGGVVFQVATGLSPFVLTIPALGAASTEVTILGNDLTGTTEVSFNGTPAAFTVESPTYIRAIVPVGASRGKVTVTTPSGTLSSNKNFLVLP